MTETLAWLETKQRHARDQAEIADLREMLREACDGWAFMTDCESTDEQDQAARERIAELRKRGGLEET